jgi:phosphopantothenate-cysteine ligase
MAAMNVVVTGGATIAPIDDVRFLTNVSSGRFAAAITEACLDHGARVWHVHSRAAELPLLRFARFDPEAAEPAAELERLGRLRQRWLAVRDRLKLVPLGTGNVADYAATLKGILEAHPIDVVILPMAVADFEPEARSGKISSELESLDVHCRRTPKVIRLVRDWAPRAYLVGFKLLSRTNPEELVRRAAEANVVTRADLTVANDLQSLLAGRHTIHLVRPGFDAETLGPAAELALPLVARILSWCACPRPATSRETPASIE